jgi:DNA invertase Pin-like site-specific DNA recombinase
MLKTLILVWTRGIAMKSAKRVTLSARQHDQQTTDNQRRELEAVAEQRGWQVVGLCGTLSRAPGEEDGRPGFDRLLKDATAGKFDPRRMVR